jgi:hypothetical protein
LIQRIICPLFSFRPLNQMERLSWCRRLDNDLINQLKMLKFYRIIWSKKSWIYWTASEWESAIRESPARHNWLRSMLRRTVESESQASECAFEFDFSNTWAKLSKRTHKHKKSKKNWNCRVKDISHFQRRIHGDIAKAIGIHLSSEISNKILSHVKKFWNKFHFWSTYMISEQ